MIWFLKPSRRGIAPNCHCLHFNINAGNRSILEEKFSSMKSESQYLSGTCAYFVTFYTQELILNNVVLINIL